MTKDYVLVKKYGVVMLNARWIRQVNQDVQKLGQVIEPSAGIDLIKHGATQYYHAGSLRERETIWVDLTTKILQQQEPENLFFYDAHLYYIYGIEALGTHAYDDYLSRRGKIFYVVGNDTFLDNHGLQLIKDKKAHSLIDEKSPFLKEGYSLRILGDYVVEAYIPDEVAPFFQQQFAHTTSLEAFDIEVFRIPFSMKAQTKLRVTHDKHVAASLKQQLLGSFPAGMRREV